MSNWYNFTVADMIKALRLLTEPAETYECSHGASLKEECLDEDDNPMNCEFDVVRRVVASLDEEEP